MPAGSASEAGPGAPRRRPERWQALEGSKSARRTWRVAQLVAELRVERVSSISKPRRATLPVMCLICIDFDRGALKLREARRALGEMRASLDAEHLKQVEKKLDDAEREAPDASD